MIFDLAADDAISACISANSVTDVYYIVNRSLKNDAATLKLIIDLANVLEIADTTENDIHQALISPMKDFEDAVIAATAARERADFIITRNVADFTASPITVVSPADFLTRWRNYSGPN